MLKFVLTKEKNNYVQYEYFPEGGSHSGLVSFVDGQCSIDALAENDKHKIYAMKMFKRLREMATKGSFDKDGIVAWY